jgi:hypothetical protein
LLQKGIRDGLFWAKYEWPQHKSRDSCYPEWYFQAK